MSISPLAVKQFLAATPDDWTWLKTVPREAVLEELYATDPILPAMCEGMMLHQLVGMFLGVAFPQFCFWYGMGIGKTLMALRLAEYWHRVGRMRKALVCAISNEAVWAWEDEAKKWGVKLPVLGLASDNSENKAEALMTMEEGIAIVAYPGLRYMVSALVPEQKRGEVTGRKILKRSDKAIAAICEGLDGLVLDESTEVAHRDSLAYSVCYQISNRTPIRYALAGRPFGRDPTMLWPQQNIIDRGASLGPTLGLFREAFCTKKKRYFGGPYSFEYVFDKSKADLLARRSGHRSLQFLTEECVDLPECQFVTKRIPFPKETLEYYERAVKALMSARGDKTARENAFIRMRQLSSGFLGVANDEYGAKAQIEFKHNPKLDMLMQCLSEIPVGRKSVIFYEYNYSGARISAALKKAHIKHSWIWSGAKNRKAQLERFLHDPECETLLVNHNIGAFSLNLQCANYAFFYESPVGCIPRDQAQRRIWRTGQTLKVTIVDLVVIGGVEERIREFHKEGGDIFAAMARKPDLFRFRKAA
jgi:hypothetical protein